jgi:hypothetical protein
MDSGLAAIIGALIGGAATLAGTVLTECIKERRQTKFDEPRKKLLKSMLESGYQWRKLETLANVTGLDFADAKRLLVEIGARGSETNANVWGLISRNPVPAHDD